MHGGAATSMHSGSRGLRKFTNMPAIISKHKFKLEIGKSHNFVVNFIDFYDFKKT